jgi:hypothetical protein
MRCIRGCGIAVVSLLLKRASDGVLAMTKFGDRSTAGLAEVLRVMGGAAVRIARSCIQAVRALQQKEGVKAQ